MEQVCSRVLMAMLLGTCVGSAAASGPSGPDVGIYVDGREVVAATVDGKRAFRLSSPFVIGVNAKEVSLCITEEDLGPYRKVDDATTWCVNPYRAGASSPDSTTLFVGPDSNNALNAVHGLKPMKLGRHAHGYTVETFWVGPGVPEVPVVAWKRPLHVVAWIDVDGSGLPEEGELGEFVLRFD